MNASTWIQAAILFSASVGLSSCATSQAASLATYRGNISSGCAPHDALSTVIDLEAIETGERASFNLWPPNRLSLPWSARFDPAHPIGAGTFCTPEGDCQAAEWGRVNLGSASGSGVIEGEWALGLPDGRVAQGRLIADWLTLQAFCG